ncbi:MAG: hypothetical protein RLZZ62_1326, partial [Actinomycetota bacterium]
QLSLALPALVAQRIEHLTSDQRVGGSSPSERANFYDSEFFGLDQESFVDRN